MTPEERLTIGQKLRKYRLEKGLTQQELSEGICTNTSISEMELGKFVIAEDKLIKICDRLGVKVEDLIEGHRFEVQTAILLGIVRIQLERQDYQAAFKVITELEQIEDLEESKQQQLIFYKADYLMRIGRANEAIRILTEVQSQMEKQDDVDDHLLATFYKYLGNAHYFASYMVKAYAYYTRAFQISMRFAVMNDLAARIVYNLGKTCSTMGFVEQAYEYFLLAEKHFVGAGDTKNLARVLFEQGAVYLERNKFEQAKECLNESFALYKSLKIWNKVHRVREEIAYSILSIEHPALAIRELLECAEEFEKTEDNRHLAFTYARVSRLMLKQGEYSKAAHYLDFAESRLNNQEHDPRLAFVLQTRAKYLLCIKEFDRCVETATKSAELFKEIGLGRESAESLELIVQSYQEQGMYKHALEVYGEIVGVLKQFQYGSI